MPEGFDGTGLSELEQRRPAGRDGRIPDVRSGYALVGSPIALPARIADELDAWTDE